MTVLFISLQVLPRSVSLAYKQGKLLMCGCCHELTADWNNKVTQTLKIVQGFSQNKVQSVETLLRIAVQCKLSFIAGAFLSGCAPLAFPSYGYPTRQWGFGFRVSIPLDWLPTKANDPSLPAIYP